MASSLSQPLVRISSLSASRVPEVEGAYLYADFGKGALRALVARRDGTIAALGDIDTGDTKLEQPVSFAEDNGGEVVVLDLAGPVYRLRAN